MYISVPPKMPSARDVSDWLFSEMEAAEAWRKRAATLPETDSVDELLGISLPKNRCALLVGMHKNPLLAQTCRLRDGGQ